MSIDLMMWARFGSRSRAIAKTWTRVLCLGRRRSKQGILFLDEGSVLPKLETLAPGVGDDASVAYVLEILHDPHGAMRVMPRQIGVDQVLSDDCSLALGSAGGATVVVEEAFELFGPKSGHVECDERREMNVL